MMLHPILLLLLVAPAAVRAAGPLTDPVPLLASAGAAAPGEGLLRLNAAHGALATGLPSIAARILEQILAAPDTPGADRNSLILDLVSARLDEGNPTAAALALKMFSGPPTAGYQLRSGLVAAELRRPADVRAALAVLRPENLAPEDRGWYYFLQGTQFDAAGDHPRAGASDQQAADAAVSDLQRAQFTLAQARAQLQAGGVTEAQAAAYKDGADRYPLRSLGYGYARQYAVAEAALGHQTEAVAYLQTQLHELPAVERSTNDDFNLLLGLIEGGAPGSAGRKALEDLLDSAADRDLQLVALQLLARASTEGAARESFRAKLTKLITLPTPHPILEDLLLYRAQLSLADHHYTGATGSDPGAEDDANKLLASFPGSKLIPEALGVLTGAAWEQQRYRTAAKEAEKTREALPSADPRTAPLGVLVAEAYFRAADFQSAAEAYASALAAPPAGVSPGSLIFQQVLAKIKAGQTAEAGNLLDRYASDPRLDQVNRWQAEWNLARVLQTPGDTTQAIADDTAQAKARVDRLLATAGLEAAGLPADLRVRMQWLQARLALDTGSEVADDLARAQTFFEEARSRAQALLDAVSGPTGLNDDFHRDVVSNTLLLRAQAEFKLSHEADAEGTLKKLRTDYPASDAAMHSYLDEADHLEEKNDLVGAENVLITLAGDFKAHPAAPGPDAARRAEQEKTYAPYALYRAALNEERRGQDEFYKAAFVILEGLVKSYEHSDLVFYAKLKQGDLMRRLNQFGAAQQIYEDLKNNFPNHADVDRAKLALAASNRAQAATDISHAQSATDISHAESAIEIFDQLRDQPTAPADVRAEAGFQYGDMLAQGNKHAEAEAAWWSLVAALLPDNAPPLALGVEGPTWLARALLHDGDLLAQDHKYDEARRAYSLLLQKGLPGQATARDRLQSLGGVPPR